MGGILGVFEAILGSGWRFCIRKGRKMNRNGWFLSVLGRFCRKKCFFLGCFFLRGGVFERVWVVWECFREFYKRIYVFLRQFWGPDGDFELIMVKK
jgi:hypothetical protein